MILKPCPRCKFNRIEQSAKHCDNCTAFLSGDLAEMVKIRKISPKTGKALIQPPPGIVEAIAGKTKRTRKVIECRILEGVKVCRRHNTPIFGESIYCEECYFRNTATTHLGSQENWESLQKLYIAQNKLCAYLGIPLTPGTNMSLDHKTPESRLEYSERNNPQNLQWICYNINIAKGIAPHDAFKALLDKMLETMSPREIDEYFNIYNKR